jgi:hypothetical protein
MVTTERSDFAETACAPMPPHPPYVDQLDYLTDLITELRDMAQRARLDTLTAILTLAQAEAEREATTHRRTGGVTS